MLRKMREDQAHLRKSVSPCPLSLMRMNSGGNPNTMNCGLLHQQKHGFPDADDGLNLQSPGFQSEFLITRGKLK